MKISGIETLVRQRINEITPRYWTSQELTDIIISGIKDLWRDVVEVKQEHFFKVNDSDVYFGASSTGLSGVPADVHKIYNIEPRDLSTNGSTHGLVFTPMDYNDKDFQSARGMDAIDPASGEIFYAITGAGGPIDAPIIYCAPQVTSDVDLSFAYIPNLPDMTTNSSVPVPGEVTNALVAWGVSYARAKEREDRAPDPGWLSIYATEKAHILESLGRREYQENTYARAVFQEYWG